MTFELKDFLEALGPSASLIFAAWIFLSFLQERYTSAYDRYRSMIDGYRHASDDDPHRSSIRRQIVLYRTRCEQMRRATNLGVIAAIALIASVIAAGVDVMLGGTGALKYVSSLAALLGLALVIAAATYVLRENRAIREAMDEEPADVPELSRDI
jgi:hypothetical protein